MADEESRGDHERWLDDQPTVTFDESAVPFVLDVLGWQTDDEGKLRDADGSPVVATDGGMIEVENVGGIVREDGEARPLRDDFVSIAEYTESQSAIERMNEYRELAEHIQVLRDNVLEMDDLLSEYRWVAAGGRGPATPVRMDRLAKACRRTAEDVEELVEDAPDPREVRDGE
jgi:hypothetical protein